MSNEPKEITPEEKWEKATIANNFIFYKVMRHNPDVCKELLEILFYCTELCKNVKRKAESFFAACPWSESQR